MDSQTPFICAYLIDRHGKGQAAELADVNEWTPGRGVLWVHLDVLSDAARAWLDTRSDIDELMREALMATETRPRSIFSDAGLLLVLRGVNTNPGADPEDLVAIRVWLEAKRVITSRRRRLLSIQDIRDSIESGGGPNTTGEFVVALVERLADRIGGVVNDIEEQLEQAEEESDESKPFELRHKLGILRRQTAAIRRYLAPQRDVLDRLYRQPGPFFSDREANALREESDRITRYLEDLDLARERAVVLQEELIGRLAHEQNSRMYLLSVIAAVFLPLTFVTGLLGMNVAGLPGTESPTAFIVSLIVMVALGVVLVLFFKWKRWI
jgi:zinc transporter